MTPTFELVRDFYTMHLPHVSSSCVYSFGSYPVDKQTNKQTDAAENTQCSSSSLRGGAENAGVENAGVEKAGAITYGKPSEQKTKTPGV